MRAVQGIATGLLAYSTWLMYKCPCERLVACSSTQLFMSMGAVVLLVAVDNNYLFIIF